MSDNAIHDRSMRYRAFGRHTGLRVSEVILGTGNFGTRWGHGSTPDESSKILDAYADVGGNFLDTADSYQFGESEEILGRLLQGRREEFVLATKLTQRADPTAGILVTGNSRKAMVSSVEQSLRRLQTDHIDLLWVHYSDGVTPVEELLRGFDDLARAGKILYAGFSDFPAWRVARAATITEIRGTLPIAALQFEHSLVERTAEAELVQAGKALGLGVAAWSPLGGGVLTGKYRDGGTGRAQGFGGKVFQPENSTQRTAILDEVIAVAKELGTTPGEVAIAWVAAQGVTPIIGPRSVEQLQSNLAALAVDLSPEQLSRLDAVSAPAQVFPYTLLDDPDNQQRITGGQLARFDRPATPVA